MINIFYEEFSLKDDLGELLKIKRNIETGKFSFSPVTDAIIKAGKSEEAGSYKIEVTRANGFGEHAIDVEEETIIFEIKTNAFEVV